MTLSAFPAPWLLLAACLTSPAHADYVWLERDAAGAASAYVGELDKGRQPVSGVVAPRAFLADGKDGYRSFADVPKNNREETFLPYADSFLKYAQSSPALERLPATEYSTQRFTGMPPLGKLSRFFQQ